MNTQKEILRRLTELNSKLETGKLNQLEMEELVQLSREFHEKCLIIRYKALEAEVYTKDNSTTKIEELNAEVEEQSTEVKPDIKEEKASSEMMFDFSTPVEEEKIEKKEEVREEEIEEKSIEENKPKAPITKVTITQPEPINTLRNPLPAKAPEQGSFYERFNSTEDNSLASKLGASKISSLKEAFGLNDRLQCISELFDGNKDKFESTLNNLDNMPSKSQAKEKLSELAVALNWDLENDLVTDFVRKVERRYA